MIITKTALSRRTVLRGACAAVALPLLDAMVPALSAQVKTAANPVRRFGAVYVPNGVVMAAWTPTTEGTSFELTPTLKALEPFYKFMIVVTGLNGPAGHDHSGASTGFLTGVPDGLFGGQRTLKAGISIDQLAARQFGQDTQLASLELGLDDPTGGSSYANTISWRSATSPQLMENNPRAVFERLFGDSGTTDPSAQRARRAEDKSVLDSVIETAASLQRRVGSGDRLKIREYLDGVRDIERRIQHAERENRELPLINQPPGIPATFEEHARLMFDLKLMAYQSDLTRVATFMIGRELSGRTYPQLGIAEPHHPLSHHGGDREKVAAIAKINGLHMMLFAEYLKKLQSTPDGDGSLLDHMMVLYGAGMSDGNAHNLNNVPLLLVGGASGLLTGGRHVKCDGEKTANLLVTIVAKLGLPIDAVGGSTHPLQVEGLSGI